MGQVVFSTTAAVCGNVKTATRRRASVTVFGRRVSEGRGFAVRPRGQIGRSQEISRRSPSSCLSASLAAGRNLSAGSVGRVLGARCLGAFRVAARRSRKAERVCLCRRQEGVGHKLRRNAKGKACLL